MAEPTYNWFEIEYFPAIGKPMTGYTTSPSEVQKITDQEMFKKEGWKIHGMTIEGGSVEVRKHISRVDGGWTSTSDGEFITNGCKCSMSICAKL